MDDKRLVRDLEDKLKKKELALFVGADLPGTITGLPSRAELSQKLAHRYGFDVSLSLAEVAQQVGPANSRYEFTSFLIENLSTPAGEASRFHDRLAAFIDANSVRYILTTRYDDSMELACKSRGIRFSVVVDDGNLSFSTTSQLLLLKIYGELGRPDSLIVTEDDHLAWSNDPGRKNVRNKLKSILGENTILFLGYNLEDPDFKLLWHQVLRDAGPFARNAYAVWPGLSEITKQIWQQRRIHVLEEAPFGLVETAATRQMESSTKLPNPVAEQDDPIVLDAHGHKPDQGNAGGPPLLGTGKHWAVLVGVNEYEDEVNYGRLHVCVKDVQSIYDRLVAGGFNPARIRMLTDATEEKPTRARILAALKAVANVVEPEDLFLFYYSGHGGVSGQEGYLVSQDGQYLVLPETAVPISRVKQIMEQSSARAKVIILDACHSGANIGNKGSSPMSVDFIQRVFDQAEGLAILGSCKQGELSYEWKARERSVFTHYLLEALEGQADHHEKGFVTVQDVSLHVTNGVKMWASQHNATQTPTLQYTVAGDIVIVKTA